MTCLDKLNDFQTADRIYLEQASEQWFHLTGFMKILGKYGVL